MTPVDRHANVQRARERALEATLQLLTGYSAEYNVSSAELLSLLVEDLQNALHRPATPLSTSARSVAAHASTLYYSIGLRHPCRNQWVCPSICNLCASNPNKRCEPEGDLASKQLEEGSLKTRCGALLQATVCRHEALQEDLPDGVFALDDFNPQDFCIEMSIVSAQSVASLTEAGADLTVEAIRQDCELLTKKNPSNLQLLRRSSSSPEDSDNQRVRADFLPSKDRISLDVKVTEGSQRRLSATQKFQLLVVLVRKADRQPVGYTLSNAFQVTTGRAEVDWNADIPCWDYPVNKLKHCGTEIRRNLLNVAECCESKGFVPPPHHRINTVRTVQDFCYLHEDICQNWGPVPQVVINALVPDKAVEHSRKMLPRDYRMRIFMPKDCQHGAMYLCQQAQVDLADSTRAVLLSCEIFRGTIRICLPERRSADQNATMSKLAKQAEAAWQLPRHPGWCAAKCMEDGDMLLDLLRQKEAENGGGLELSWQALANMLSLDERIFQPSMMHGGAPQLAQPQGGAHWGLPPTQQQPLQVPAGHLGAQQSPVVGTSNQAFPQDQPPQVLQAWPDNPAGSGNMLPGDVLLPGAGQAGQFAAGPSAMAEADPFALPSHVIQEPPSASGNMLGPQGQPTGFDPFFSAQAIIPTLFPGLADAGSNMPPQGVPVLHSQDISSHAGSISPDDMRYTASASAYLGTVSPADSHLSYQSRSGHAQQSTDTGAGLLQQQQYLQQQQFQQQQQPFAGMRQDFQPAGQVPIGLGQTPGAPELEAVVFSGVPVQSGVRGFVHTQSDRVRRKPPSRNASFTDREVKRRSTAPAGMLDDTLDHICNDPFQDHPQGGAGNENGLWGSGALVAASQQATHWPMGSNNSHQRQRGWAAQTSPSSFHIDLPGLPSLVFADSVDRPVQQHTWVLPQYDGAGDLSSEDISFLDKDDVMSLLAPGGLGDDDADSEQRAGGEDEVEEIQPQVPYVVFVFLAKMRALVVRRRRHQLGAVAESLALDSCRKRMLERAVIARFAKSGHANAIEGTRAASMDLSDLVGGSARDLWDEAGPQDDNHFLLDMAAEYCN